MCSHRCSYFSKTVLNHTVHLLLFVVEDSGAELKSRVQSFHQLKTRGEIKSEKLRNVEEVEFYIKQERTFVCQKFSNWSPQSPPPYGLLLNPVPTFFFPNWILKMVYVLDLTFSMFYCEWNTGLWDLQIIASVLFTQHLNSMFVCLFVCSKLGLYIYSKTLSILLSR